MKTIEERTQEIITKYRCPTPTSLKGLIEESMRALAGDCAKICDEHEQAEQAAANESARNGKGLSHLGHVFEASAAKTIGDKIRALLTPEPVMGAECIMFGCEKRVENPEAFKLYCPDHEVKGAKEI